MKRFLVLALAATALSFPAAITAAKPIDSVKGPVCGDITLNPDYTTDPGGSGSATTQLTIDTAAPSCKNATYTIYVYDQTGANQLASCPYSGDGVTSHFGPCQYTSASGDPLCVYATSQGDDGHIIDTAPNEGCQAPFGEPIVPGPSGATGFH